MAYRNGTYIAFDGLGEADPSMSDFRYYALIQGWAKNKNIEFNFVNSHEKASAVRDTSKRDTLKASICARLSNSKNMLVLLSDNTRKSGSMLTYEIEKGVDTYELPLIIAYVNYSMVTNPSSLSSCWPNALERRIENGTAKAVHIPFLKEAVLRGIDYFNCARKPSGSLEIFRESIQRSSNPALAPTAPFVNTRK